MVSKSLYKITYFNLGGKKSKGDIRDGEMSLTASKHKRRKQMVTFHFEGVVKKYSNSISLIFTRELRHVF